MASASHSVGPVIPIDENEKKVLRFHMVQIVYSQEGYQCVYEYKFKKFVPPEKLTLKQVLKVVSYLMDYFADMGFGASTYDAVKAMDDALERYGFTHLDTWDRTPCSDIFFTLINKMEDYQLIKEMDIMKNDFKFYIPNVRKKYIKKLYNVLGLPTNQFLVDNRDEPPVSPHPNL